MRVCAGCENEYQEDFKFCPECGRPFGGSQAENANDLLNRSLRAQAASAMRETRLEQAAARGPLDIQPDFELSPASANLAGRLAGEFAAGVPGPPDDRG